MRRIGPDLETGPATSMLWSPDRTHRCGHAAGWAQTGSRPPDGQTEPAVRCQQLQEQIRDLERTTARSSVHRLLISRRYSSHIHRNNADSSGSGNRLTRSCGYPPTNPVQPPAQFSFARSDDQPPPRQVPVR